MPTSLIAKEILKFLENSIITQHIEYLSPDSKAPSSIILNAYNPIIDNHIVFKKHLKQLAGKATWTVIEEYNMYINTDKSEDKNNTINCYNIFDRTYLKEMFELAYCRYLSHFDDKRASNAQIQVYKQLLLNRKTNSK